ncbi:MAG: tyrosine--tRNA ligase [Puniceicoccales bacterium]|jgi:tyrosyl-tRNA synthetase|nr:tyrosine--tRNA ligase [Puniceicoccales bacterium]
MEGEAFEKIYSGAENVIGGDELRKKMEGGRRLKVKLGVDPTRPDLTFGPMVVFIILRQFQDLGHEAILLIGDYTTIIGDPSGRSETRPILSKEEIEYNSHTYLDQAFKVLDPEKTTVRRNSEWFAKMSFEDALHLARRMTVARMLERDDFSKRYADGTPISIVEFLYPLLQGHDSVELHADVELGGNDQLFNLLVGRALQKEAGQSEQCVITMPLLVGLDGKRKMSKSYGNYVSFNDSPKDMFGKIMSIDDKTMYLYYKFLLFKTDSEIYELESMHPMECKKQLAHTLTARFFGSDTADHELEQFENIFSKNDLPDDMEEFFASDSCQTIFDALFSSGKFTSKKELHRLINQGGIKVDGIKLVDPQEKFARKDGSIVVQAGKRLFFRIK